MRAAEQPLGLVPLAVAPVQHALQGVGEAELAHQPLPLGQLRGRHRGPLHPVPVGRVHRQLGQGRLQLDGRRHVAHLLGLGEGIRWYQPVGAVVVLAGVAVSQGAARRTPEVRAQPVPELSIVEASR